MANGDFISDNKKRLKKIFKPINPLFGDSQDPYRFPFFINGIKKAYLPIAMYKIPLIRKMVKAKSLSKFIRSSFFKHNFNSVAQLFDHFHNLRLKFDFMFWIHHNYKHHLLYNPAISLIRYLQKLKNENQPLYLIIRKNENQDLSVFIHLFLIWHLEYSKVGLNFVCFSKSQFEARKHRDFFLHWNDAGNKISFSKTNLSCLLCSSQIYSKFWFLTATSPDSCRSLDFSFLYLSDMNRWNDPKNHFSKKIISASFPVILNSSHSAIIMESGPSKRNSIFNKELAASMSNLSPFKTVFVPWFHNPASVLHFDFPDDRINLYHLIHKYKNRKSLPRFKNVSGKYIYSLWQNGIPLESINWYLAESTFYAHPSQFTTRYPPILHSSNSPTFQLSNLPTLHPSN